MNALNEQIRVLRTNIEMLNKALESTEISNLERLSLTELKNILQKNLEDLLESVKE